MVKKVKPAPNWPIIKGEYEVGNPENPVAVVTCGSHLKGEPILAAGASITGPNKTENLGIEKLVANVVSNPNIRFVLVTGAEVKGHIAGEAIVRIHQNGIKDGRIIGASGAIPYIENLTDEAIKRFQQQVQVIDFIGPEDMNQITARVKEIAAKDPGAFEAEPMIVKVAAEEEGVEEAAGVRPMAAELAVVQARMKGIQQQTIDIGNMNKLMAGIYTGKIEGILIGLVFTLAIFGLLFLGGV